MKLRVANGLCFLSNFTGSLSGPRWSIKYYKISKSETLYKLATTNWSLTAAHSHESGLFLSGVYIYSAKTPEQL